MLEINLLPDIKSKSVRAKKLKNSIVSISIILSLVFVALFGSFYYYVDFYQKDKINSLSSNIISLTSSIKSNKNLNKILTIQNQLNSLPNILSQDPRISRIFNFISELTPTNATISDLTINLSNNSISINGGADSLTTVNQFVDTLKFTTYDNGSSKGNTAFNSVDLTSFSYSSGSNTTTNTQYTITFNYDPTLFNNTDKIQLVIPKLTTTRSILDQPTAIFQSNTKG